MKKTYKILLSLLAVSLFFIATGCRSHKHYETKYMAAASIDFKKVQKVFQHEKNS